MTILKKLYLILFCLMFCGLIYLSQGFAQTIDKNLNNYLVFQVIQDQFIFDNSTIKNAILIEENGAFRGLEVELKASAVDTFNRMTMAGMGKSANLLLNKKVISTSVIQSALGAKLLITGISKEEAQQFLIALQNYQINNQPGG